MKYMLDTNICVYIIKKKPENVLAHVKEKIKGGLSVSSITLAELEYGVQASARPDRNALALYQFLAIVHVLPFDDEAAEEYGRVRALLQKKGTPIGPLDTLIAAHAKAKGLIVVTNNVREFERVDGLSIENWAKE